jgi:hypothetical protein
MTMDEVNSWVRVFMAAASCNVSPCLDPAEIDYIISLDGEYRTLALMQAALNQLTRFAASEFSRIELKDRIKKFSEILADKEVVAYRNNQVWANKYGELQMLPVKGKMQASFFTGDALNEEAKNVMNTWKNHECELCKDTGWICDYSSKRYPCSCPLGDKHAKKTEYIGPPVTIPNIPKIPTNQTQEQVKAYKVIADLQAEEKQLLQEVYGKQLGNTLWNQLAASEQGITSNKVTINSQPVTTVKEAPKGRKFRGVK